MSENIEYTEYVKLEDLDREFDQDTHPTLKQINKYLKRSNMKITNYFQANGIDDQFGGALLVGIELTEIQIHNRRFQDGMLNYEKRFMITKDMEKTLLGENFSLTGGFLYSPSGTFPGG